MNYEKLKILKLHRNIYVFRYYEVGSVIHGLNALQNLSWKRVNNENNKKSEPKLNC